MARRRSLVDADAIGRLVNLGSEPLGLVVVGRPTFDLASARPLVAEVVTRLADVMPVVGGPDICTTEVEVLEATAAFARVRAVVVVFASFADSRLAAAAATSVDLPTPLILWSFPEPWTGGRLLRNSLCGSNLAAFRFGLEGRPVAAIHAAADNIEIRIRVALRQALTPRCGGMLPRALELDQDESRRVNRALARVGEARVGIVGDPPPGFEPCEIGGGLMPFGVAVEHIEPAVLFDLAAHASPGSIAQATRSIGSIDGGTQLDADGVGRSMALRSALEALQDLLGWDALAVRCWPECFTQWGSAACGSMSMLNDAGVPAACESDAFGAVTMLLLQELAERPVFLADLVDIDVATDEVVFWHCGVAPRSMADPKRGVRVAVHPNREVPLVFDFGLEPGPVTIARLSQSLGRLRLVIGFGTVEDLERPFEGTSAVVALDGSAQDLLSAVISEGLEHHYVVAPGDHRRALESIASEWTLPIVWLSRHDD